MSTYGRRMQRTVTATVLAAALAVTTAACGDDSGDGPGGTSGGEKADIGLSTALGGVPLDQAGETLTYWNVPEARRLVEQDRKLYEPLAGFGISEVVEAGYKGEAAREAVGFDETTVDTSVLVGSDATRLTGRFDVAAVTGAMKERGWTETKVDGAPLLSAEGARVTVSADVRSSSGKDEGPLLPLSAPKDSVATDPAHRAAVDCLGDDAYLATFYGKDRPRQLPGLTLFAIGARAAEDGTSKERLCAVTQSADAASAVADALRPKTAAGERFAGARVDVGEGAAPVVRMEWANTAEVGLRPGDQNRTGQLPQLLWGRR
ncbi:hypothetical protein [Streptomyces sp. NPDC048057]|uniref:hypothetical protein n=1 Tax=Streptomyces sp. NPDC048057 TaxID=3155628 RepID=UPI0033E86ED7